ncbi:acyl-CoA carboxylase epsilon subunit [Streptomyces platensis]|uniref:acyl-CoA carboxylase epsilon subunit n=1 Tax=Streptomyces platensis TaxID=58346 RepID=UPI003C2FD287
MSTSTDASTALSEATRLGEGTTLDERTADGAAVSLGEGPAATGAQPAAAEEDTAADAGRAPDESVALGGTHPGGGGGPVAEEDTTADHTTPLDGSAPGEDPPVSWLRIEKGHAEPEEIAAISVVLCAQLAGLHALAEDGPPTQPPPGRRHPPHRSACWSGCWTCG